MSSGRFEPGTSGNASGRPRGFKGVAAEIMRRTRDGGALIEFAERVWQDPERSNAERWAAFEWLSDRGMGRAVNVSEMSLAVDRPAQVLPAGFDALDAAGKRAAIAEVRRRVLAAAAPNMLALGAGDDE